VVDDAIVVLENIYRHIESGMAPLQAALVGVKEISFAVVAMTLTLAAVYAPIAFMTGRTGRLFVEFALTLAGAVIVSGFTALTLSPMMCSKLLRHQETHGRFYNAIERALEALTNHYRRMLSRALDARWFVVLCAVAVALLSAVLFKVLKQELAPVEDRGTVLGVFFGPEGATIDFTDRYARRLEEIYAKTPDVERYFVVSGNPVVSQGLSFVGLSDWDARRRKSADVAAELRPKFFSLPGVFAFPILPLSLGQSPRAKPVEVVIVTSGSYEELERVVGKVMAEAQKNPGLLAVETDLRLNKPEIKVQVDRDRVADAGVQVEGVGRVLETMLGGRQVTRFKMNAEQYDVIVQMLPADRTNPNDIADIFVRGRADTMVPLSSIVTSRLTVAPRELNHFAQRRAATISANLAPGYSLGEALGFLEDAIKKELPPGAAIDFNGVSREFRISSAGLYFTFLLALAFIYLVLAAQFESFRDPFIIMVTVPLSLTGALGALYLTGNSLNVFSQIGLVTLVGLITKHGILLVEFSNQLRDQGKAMREAVIEAAVLRLRPILMTTGAMVLGAVPLALAHGAGAESRSAIGWVIVGGLLLGTPLTLLVVPTVYTLLARRKRAEAQPAAGGAPAPAPAEGH
jgi:multidrug efflux pump